MTCWKALAVFCGICVVIMVVQLVLWRQRTSVERSRLTVLVAKCRALGIPWTADEVDTRTRPSSAHDATPILESLALIDRRKKDGSRQSVSGESDDRSRIQLSLKENKAFLDKMNVAIRRGFVVMDANPDLGAFSDSHLDRVVRVSAKLIRLRAYERALNHRPEEALEDVRRLSDLAEMVGRAPHSWASFNSCTVLRQQNRLCERLASLWRDDDGLLDKLDKTLSQPVLNGTLEATCRAMAYDMVATVRNYHVFGLDQLQNSEVEQPPVDESKLIRSGLPNDPRLCKDLSQCLTIWQESWPTIRRIDVEPEVAASLEAGLAQWCNNPTELDSAVQAASNLQSTIEDQAKLRTHRRATLTLVRAFRYRLAHHQWPANCGAPSSAPSRLVGSTSFGFRAKGQRCAVYVNDPDGTQKSLEKALLLRWLGLTGVRILASQPQLPDYYY